jgi:hypothetical protein
MKNENLVIQNQISINNFIASLLHNNKHQIDPSEISDFSVIENPNLNSNIENKERWNLFNHKFWLFNRFIPHCDYFECKLKFPECMDFVEIINEESWFQKLPVENRLATDLDYSSFPNSYHKLKILQLLESGIENFINEKTLVLIGKYDNNKISLLDGNHRFLALYEAFKQKRVKNIEIKAIVGFTYGNCRWIGDQDKWEERPSYQNNKRYVLNIW